MDFPGSQVKTIITQQIALHAEIIAIETEHTVGHLML